MVKRTLCVFLALVTVLTLWVPAFAESEPDAIAEPEITMEPEVIPEPEGTPEPEVTPEPEITSEPEVTAEPEATEAPQATEAPEATAAPVPAAASVLIYLYADNEPNGLRLHWDPVEAAVLYRLYWKETGSGDWALLAETADTSFLWTGAVSGVEYGFSLQYVTADGAESEWGQHGDRQTVYTVYMAQPGNIAVTRDGSGITVTWDPVPGANSYDVFYRWANSDSWTQIRPNRYSQYYTVKGANSYTWSYSGFDSAEPDTAYYFTVRANEGTTYSILGSQSSYDQTGILSPTLSAPELVSAKNDKNYITIQWKPLFGVAQYRVFYKTGSGSWKKADDTAETSYTWKKAASGKTYTFTVRAMTAGKEYASAYDKTGKTVTHTDMPKISKAAWSGKNVKLSWSKVKGAAKYRVFYRIGDGKWKKLADTTSGSYTWKKAKSSTIYYFTVRTIDKAGKTYTSDYNNAGKLLAAAAGPKLTGAKNVSGGVTISWKAMSGAAQYRVFYKTGSGSWKRLGTTSSASYTWSGGKTGTKYAFTVRCLSADGKSYTSAYDKKGVTVTYKPVSSSKPGSGGSGSSSGGSSGSGYSGPGSGTYRTPCTKCFGDGKVTCSACGGSGTEGVSSGTLHSHTYCRKCYGSGEVNCPKCGGSGWIYI